MSTIDPAGDMPCHEAELLISRRIDGELHDADIPRLDAHLTSCDTCRETLSDWEDQSGLVSNELDGLWNKPEPFSREKPVSAHATRIRKLAKPCDKSKKIKPCMWVPISMIASQFVAFLLFGVYCLFWPQSAEAPYGPSARPEPPTTLPIDSRRVPDAEEVQRNLQRPAMLPITGPIIAAPRPAMPREVSPNDWPTTQPWQLESSEPVVMASFDREPLKLERVDNKWMTFSVEAEGGVQNGRLSLLTDASSGRTFVRIHAANGSTLDVASNEIESLDPTLRAIVQRFIEAATKAERAK